MFTLPGNLLTSAPIYHKLQPAPKFLQANIEPAINGFMCEVSLVKRRMYIECEYEVYLPHSTDKVVYLRPAFGETRRNPQRFVAIVLIDGNEKRSKTVAINAGQKLMVV